MIQTFGAERNELDVERGRDVPQNFCARNEYFL